MKFVNHIDGLEFICVDTANEKKMFLDDVKLKLNVLDFLIVVCMCLSSTTTSMSPNKLHVLFLEAAACF